MAVIYIYIYFFFQRSQKTIAIKNVNRQLLTRNLRELSGFGASVLTIVLRRALLPYQMHSVEAPPIGRESFFSVSWTDSPTLSTDCSF